MQILVLYFNIGCRVKSRWYANYLFQCHISHIKTAVLYYLIYSCSRLCFTKTKSPFFLPQYAAPLLDNLIKVLSPRLRAKSTMNESLDFSWSWDRFVYKVEKSYTAIDFASVFILMASEVCKTQNFFKFDKNLENCFVEHISYAMMKCAPVGFLCILGIQ